MKSKDKNRLRERLCKVLRIQSVSRKEERMVRFIEDELSRVVINPKEGEALSIVKDDTGNILVTKTSARDDVFFFPCVAAHMDTVHPIVDERDYRLIFNIDSETKEETITTNTGIGGDDKVGIFVALEALHTFDDIKVVFFTNEEIGCVGSKAVDMSFFADCGMVLQCDRRGNNEMIRNGFKGDLYSDEFLEDMEDVMDKHGYLPSYTGSYTDVVQLNSRGLDICVANIGSGYYKAHTKNEYINVNDVMNCLSFVFALIDNCYGFRYDNYASVEEEEDDLPITDLEVFNKNYNSQKYNEKVKIGDTEYWFPSEIDCPCGVKSTMKNDRKNNYFCTRCNEYVTNSEDLINELEK